MSRKKTGRQISGDPRKSGGDIAGPGGPHDRNSVIVDTTNAVILDATTVTQVETLTGKPALAMMLEGRIARTQDRARNLYLMDEDGAAALISELLALGHRMGPAFGRRLMERVEHLVGTDSFTGER